MKTLSLAGLCLAVLAVGSVDAAVYKGQREYVKKCRTCHGDGQKLMASKDKSQWETIMKKDGEALAKLHLGNEKAKESWEYFKDGSFAKKAKHLQEFMEEYASDSGNVPACN